MKNQYKSNPQSRYHGAFLSLSKPGFAQVVLLLLLFAASYGQAQNFPAGFSQELVTNGLNRPNVIAFAPDGRIFVAEQGGALRVIKGGNLLPTPFIQLSVDAEGERGLIGLTLDPNFAQNQYVYLFYTVPSSPSHNRISRFTANGDVVLGGSELVLLDMEPLSATNHNGGSLSFGKDGKLYAGVGENAVVNNSQTLENHLGKILRINPDGSIPSDNPFPTGSAPKRRIWAYGLRNPYTITTQPGTGRFFVNDVGQTAYEEINEASTGGLNFGWPNAEGPSSNLTFANPAFAYPHGAGDGSGCAITGGTFFNPPSSNYPSNFTGKYFYQDLCNQWINMIDISGSGATRSAFATGLSGLPVGLTTGLDGNLYYLSLSDNALYRINYTPAQQPPTPTAFAITGVNLMSCATVTAGKRILTFAPQYAGLTGQPVSFWVRNEMVPTTNAGPHTLTLYTDNPTITLKATQAGTSGEASFTYNWLAVCSGDPAANTPPTVANQIPNQPATIGQAFNFSIPTSTFTDAQTPNNLTFQVNGLPAGMTFTAPATISGVPSSPGLSEVTVTATDPGQLSASTVFTITVSPASVQPPTGFAITGVNLMSCATIGPGKRMLTFTPQYAGLTGQPVSFWVRNEMLPTTNSGPYSLAIYTDNPTITLNAVQAGTAGEASFSYNWLGFCTGSARLGAEPTAALTVSVLGNPVHGETVDVDVRGAIGESLRLQTFNSQGNRVGEILLEQATATERATVRLGSSAGLYFLQVSTPTQKKTVKIMKL